MTESASHPLAVDTFNPFSSSALDTDDLPTSSPSRSPPLSPRHSSSYPSKPLSPRPTSALISTVPTATTNGAQNYKKKHRASFDVHLPSIALIGAAPGAAHLGTVTDLSGPAEKTHRFPTRVDDTNHDLTKDELSPGRRRVLDDCLKLFCSQPSLEILERTWRPDATFQDPIALCHGFHEYAPQWFAMPKAFPHSRTLSLHLHHPSPSDPSEFKWEQVQEYTIRGLGTKKLIHSLVVVQLDEEDKIRSLEDRWDAKELPTRYGSLLFRKLNAKIVPWLIHVPKQ